jgi:hypothetical protein
MWQIGKEVNGNEEVNYYNSSEAVYTICIVAKGKEDKNE